MRITIITLGTRGDVQPLVGLGVGLKRRGHQVRLATHTRFHDFVRSHGLDPFEIQDWGPGDDEKGPESSAEKLRAITHYAGLFLRSLLSRDPAPTWPEPNPLLDRFMEDSWRACQDTDLIISWLHYAWIPHIVEKLNLPCYLVHVSPLTPTRELPNLALCVRTRLGGVFNRFTYWLPGKLFLYFGLRITNRWRQESLGLPPLSRTRPLRDFYAKTRVLYAFSSAVIPRPEDWPDGHHVTGFWYLDGSTDWQPPDDLSEFLDAGPPPVCIGFGQVADKYPQFTVPLVLEALERANQRAVLITRRVTTRDDPLGVPLPDTVYRIDAVPHGWLFPRCSAIVTHGGAGTMAAAFRAGTPTITVPFGGDQPFWAYRAYKVGVAAPPLSSARLTASGLAAAIKSVVSDDVMRARARTLSERIGRENGIERTIDLMERFLHAARTMPAPEKTE